MPRLVAGTLLLVWAAVLLAACGGDDDSSATGTPGASEAPTATQQAAADRDPTDSPTSAPTDGPSGPGPLYLSLGDSLAAGIGASDQVETAWVPLVHDALPGWELVNLGIPGDDSSELLFGGPLDEGLSEISRRATDDIDGNEAGAITLEIGGNDLLDIYFDLVVPGTCPSVAESLQREVCVSTLEEALSEYRTNLAEILDRIESVAPDVPVFLMTLYNPFSGGGQVLDEVGVLALEGQPGTPFPEGLNDIIREEGEATGVTLVEWYELFLDKQSEYISGDLIHPNDAGQAVMAEAVIEAMAQAGLPVVD